MNLFSKNNHLKFGFGSQFCQEQSTSDSWGIYISEAKIQYSMSSALSLACNEILEVHQDSVLFLSGNSLDGALKKRPEFRETPILELRTDGLFEESHSKRKILDLDYETFLDKNYLKEFSSYGPIPPRKAFAFYCMNLASKLLNKQILSTNDELNFYFDDFQWKLNLGLDQLFGYLYFKKNMISGVPYFFLWSPELIYSILTTSSIQSVVRNTNQNIGHLNLQICRELNINPTEKLNLNFNNKTNEEHFIRILDKECRLHCSLKEKLKESTEHLVLTYEHFLESIYPK